MVPYKSDRGPARFAERLRSMTETCAECGFKGTILDSAWHTKVTEHPKSGHVTYQMRCPDCGTPSDVEINLP